MKRNMHNWLLAPLHGWMAASCLLALALFGSALAFPSIWKPAVIAGGAAMPVAGLVTTALRRRRIRQFVRAGGQLCTSCGFDLRGLASGRCPECGTVPTK